MDASPWQERAISNARFERAAPDVGAGRAVAHGHWRRTRMEEMQSFRS